MLITNYLLKVLWEIILTPVTYRVVAFFKRAEGLDVLRHKDRFHAFHDQGVMISPLQQAKLFLVAGTGLAKDALHIYVGLLVFLAVAAALRTPVSNWRPAAAVTLIAIAAEVWDIIDTLAAGQRLRPGGNVHDIVNTMFWPLVIMALARFTQVFTRR